MIQIAVHLGSHDDVDATVSVYERSIETHSVMSLRVRVVVVEYLCALVAAEERKYTNVLFVAYSC